MRGAHDPAFDKHVSDLCAQGLSVPEIARQTSRHPQTIYTILRRHGLKARSIHKHRIISADPDRRRGVCAFCGPVRIKPCRVDGKIVRWRCKPSHTEGIKIGREDGPGKKGYYISLKVWHAMIEAQDNTCAICRRSFTPERPPQTDHCHKTGVVRGALCTRCNLGLGMFIDEPQLLLAAAAYLQK